MNNRILALLLWLCCSAWVGAKAQTPEIIHKLLTTPKDSLPYKADDNLPAFNIRLLDSATVFNTKSIEKGRYTAIMLFSPDCSHCQNTVEKLLANIDSLANIDFYMVSHTHNVSDIMKFSEKYKLASYNNIKVVGQDYGFFCLVNYGVKSVPDIALYDKHKKFVKLIESTITVKDLYDSTH